MTTTTTTSTSHLHRYSHMKPLRFGWPSRQLLRNYLVMFLLSSTLSTVLYPYPWTAWLPWLNLEPPSEIAFRFPESWPPAQLLVDLPGKCQIPNISPWPWSKELATTARVVKILPKLGCHDDPDDNRRRRRRISYVHENKIILDMKLLDTMNGLGLWMRAPSCCYRSIHHHHRLQPSLESYNNEDAEYGFYYSDICEPMSEVTIPKFMFVKVECKYSSARPLVYEKFHAVPLLPPPAPPQPRPLHLHHPHPHPDDMGMGTNNGILVSSRVQQITDFWEQCSKTMQLQTGNVGLGLDENEMKLCNGFRRTASSSPPPPNVLLLGIDSTSRLNFRRWMNKTVGLLERIGAVEMLGYSAVGENTFSNLGPMIMSLSEKELRSTCQGNNNSSDSSSLEDCPHIWKEFSSLNYLTAHLEDEPLTQIKFNNNYHQRTTGFVIPPTDIHLVPLMQALYKKGLSKLRCDAYESVEELILNFAVELMTTAASKSVPTFISTWMSGLTRENFNGLQQLDDVFYEALRKLEEEKEGGILENTIVLVVGGPGYRDWEYRNRSIRHTLSGHFEVKLPALWIHLPETIKKSKAKWMRMLRRNRRILATPYDVHATLHHILTSANSEYKEDLSKEETATEWGGLKKKKVKGSSLFRPLPHRNCAEAHIPREFCSCETPVHYNESEMMQIAATATVEYINSRLPDVCETLGVTAVYYSGLLRDPSQPEWNSSSEDGPKKGDGLVLGMDVNPGRVKMEALIDFENKDYSAAFTNVTRTLRTNPPEYILGRCLNDTLEKVEFIREWCICKWYWWWVLKSLL